ncbi:hypothetical protein XU18_4044 [Perkinsela sp. CCAP 1560/4]|nr:hypothetical protein XU18_4044 [Perkinsela sp. CCAP 1560/4]|eukprot:KNH04757.1 hypothetical protein XU18_4044 [Perkinsela sp. CCAP 1560/4]
MKTDIKSILSSLSKCTQALVSARAGIEEGRPVDVDGYDWRWNDITCRLPDKLIRTIRQLKRTLVNENNTIQSFREDQKELGLKSFKKNADMNYQEKIHRHCFDFLHRCHFLTEEIFPILEICSNELWATCQDRELYVGELKQERCAALYRNVMRLLVAITTLSEDSTFQLDELRLIKEESLQSLITTARLCAVLRHPSRLLIRAIHSEASESDSEAIELSFRYLTNITKIVCSEMMSGNAQKRFIEAFYESGGIEFVILFVKASKLQTQRSIEPSSCDSNIVSLFANLFSFMRASSKWAVISREIHTENEFDTHLHGTDHLREKSQEIQNILPRSRGKALLTRESIANGEVQLCNYGKDGNLSRFYQLDAIKNQKSRRVKKHKNFVTSSIEDTVADHSPQISHIQWEQVLGKLMHGFLENCFIEWLDGFWPIVHRWSRVADDGTEKVDEREALSLDHACPTTIANFFFMLGCIFDALRENLIFLKDRHILSMGSNEAEQKYLELHNLMQSTLLSLFGILPGSPDTGDGEDETHPPMDSSNIRSFIHIAATALKITSAVHRRKLYTEKSVMLRFLFEVMRTGITFSTIIPKKWLRLLIIDGGLWSKTESMFHSASNSLGTLEGKYLNTLIAYVHVTILLMGKFDSVEGESAAVLSIASNPKSLRLYISSLEEWQQNPLETNRAIQYLLYQMINLRCHGPILNIHTLFTVYDILIKTQNSTDATAKEMRTFALSIARSVISAIMLVGKEKAVPRLLFAISSTAWQEVTSASSPLYVDTKDLYEDIDSADENETNVNAGVTDENVPSKKEAKVCNKDQGLMRDARRKLRHKKEKAIHRRPRVSIVSDSQNVSEDELFVSDNHKESDEDSSEMEEPVDNAEVKVERTPTVSCILDIVSD